MTTLMQVQAQTQTTNQTTHSAAEAIAAAYHEAKSRSAWHRPQSDFDLFSRAILHKNQVAWEDIYAIYHPYLVGLIRARYYISLGRDEDVLAELAHAALARFARCYTPAKFGLNAAGLAGVLKYLVTCATSEVFDYLAAQKRVGLQWEPDADDQDAQERELDKSADADPVFDEIARRDMRERLWRCLEGVCRGDHIDLLIVHSKLRLGRKPAEIFASNRHLFKTKQEVFDRWHNFMDRLERSGAYLQLVAQG